MSTPGIKSDDLAAAIDGHDPELVEKLLAAGADANAPMDYPNSLPLHAAIHEVLDGAPVNLVHHLLAFHADVNQPDEFGFFPLGIAVGGQRMDLVEVLLKAGADPNARSGEGELPLHLAVENGDLDICLALLGEGATETINEWSTTSGLTPLGCAAQRLDLAIVQALRMNGASNSAKDDDYKTPRERLPGREEANWELWDKVATMLG